MTPARKSTPPEKKNVTTIGGDVVDSVIVTGDNNQTIIQKFFNIFKNDSETLEHRNRRILLGHVENAWIKGVLDDSLHGAALLDLGIKPDPEAVTKYPWAIKKELTDETLPAGTSMLEIFDTIGMGRSLLILGAPGSGKTTMLLELARQLIARAREDVTQPIPMVFNLASWTEKLTLADWLAQELNNLYSVPRKTAPDWVKGNKLLLLLDGLDEVRQDSRAKCVEAINEFRNEHGLTSLAVCSRSQDYADLNAKLSFEGAIEVQPLTQEQITEFFNRFGKEMAGIKQVLKRDSALREMAETPLFLSIMVMAYRDKRDVEILTSQGESAQRKHLFDTYIERMFERLRSNVVSFKKQDVSHWLSWLAKKMIEEDQIPHLVERIQQNWLKNRILVRISILISRLLLGLIFGYAVGKFYSIDVGENLGWVYCFIFFIITWIISLKQSRPAELLRWSWQKSLRGLWVGLIVGSVIGLIVGVIFMKLDFHKCVSPINSVFVDDCNESSRIYIGSAELMLLTVIFGCVSSLIGAVSTGIEKSEIVNKTIANEGIRKSLENSLYIVFISGLGLFALLSFCLQITYLNNTPGSVFSEIFIAMSSLIASVIGISIVYIGPVIVFSLGIYFGGFIFANHYTVRLMLFLSGYIPWNYTPFLDHCVDLIFLRRVGGGYIFIHRLLMEHFAEMYAETPTSKGNQK